MLTCKVKATRARSGCLSGTGGLLCHEGWTRIIVAVAALIRASVLLLEKDEELGDEFDPVWLTESSGSYCVVVKRRYYLRSPTEWNPSMI